MPKIKISQLPAKAANLAATDLLEVSEVSGLTYVSKKITGSELVGNRVPYTGATTNVDLGEYELKAGQLTLDVSPTGTAAVGTTRWNDSLGSSETTLKGGSVILKNGVDLVARVVNKVSPNTTLTKATYPVVKVSGAQGQRLAVAYAQANNDNNSADTLGVVTETIATNQEGFILTVGQLEGINTTGSLQGESWADGHVLYLSPTIPGGITNIKPNGSTGHIVVIGYVEYSHAINGKIYVKIMNGWELDELHNVYINPATLANNQVLTYESSTQLWKNQTPNTGITVGTTAVTSGTNGRVFFQAGGVVQQDANFTFDNTLKRLTLKAVNTGAGDIPFAVQNSAGAANHFTVYGNDNVGIGRNSSANAVLFIRSAINAAHDVLTLQNSFYGDHLFRIRDHNNGQQSSTCSIFIGGRIYGGNSVTQRQFDIGGYGLGGIYGENGANTVLLNNEGNVGDAQGSTVIAVTSNVYINNQTTKKYKFETVTGNFGIGNVGTLGARLDVRAQGALSTDIAFRVQNSVGSANIFSVQGDGTIVIPTTPRIDTTAGTFLQTNGFGSLYVGTGNTSIANYTNTVFGNSNTLSGSFDNYTILGQSNNVAGNRNIAIGISNKTSGDASIRIGHSTGQDTFGGNSSMHFGRAGGGGFLTYSANEVANFFFNDHRTSQMFRSNGSILLSGKNSQIITDANVTTFMGDGGNTLVVRNHTSVPSLNITDSFQQYSADITANNAAPHFRTENGSIIKLYQQSSAGIATVGDLVTVLQNLGLLS